MTPRKARSSFALIQTAEPLGLIQALSGTAAGVAVADGWKGQAG